MGEMPPRNITIPKIIVNGDQEKKEWPDLDQFKSHRFAHAPDHTASEEQVEEEGI
jgi:hypothetical protein